jgi:hypothetical protein
MVGFALATSGWVTGASVVVVAPICMAGEVTVGGGGGRCTANDVLDPPDATPSQPNANTAPPPTTAASALTLIFFSAAMIRTPWF